MTPDKLIHNANQIASYFAAYPRDEAVRGVADHLNRFWEKRMRQRLQQVLTDGDPRLHELVNAAGPLLKG